jgi:hypothetical protein
MGGLAMRTREQITAELDTAKRQRDHARDTIEVRLEQAASMRIMYAHQSNRIDRLLDELAGLPAQSNVGEAA